MCVDDKNEAVIVEPCVRVGSTIEDVVKGQVLNLLRITMSETFEYEF